MELSFVGLVILTIAISIKFGIVVGIGVLGAGLIAINIIRVGIQLIVNHQKRKALEARNASKN